MPLFKAAHFGPTMLVTTIAFLLSLTQFSFFGSLSVAIAIFFGQLVVGWTNDLIDYPLDKAAHRMNKPLVAGSISPKVLRISICFGLLTAFVISIASPLKATGTALHFLGILSATLYNVKLKSTIFSPLPYAFSFGVMPWAIYLSAGTQPPLWLYVCFILFAAAFHFLNVLKDLEWDVSQQVLGLPQRLGRAGSRSIAVTCIALGILSLVLGLLAKC